MVQLVAVPAVADKLNDLGTFDLIFENKNASNRHAGATIASVAVHRDLSKKYKNNNLKSMNNVRFVRPLLTLPPLLISFAPMCAISIIFATDGAVISCQWKLKCLTAM